MSMRKCSKGNFIVVGPTDIRHQHRRKGLEFITN